MKLYLNSLFYRHDKRSTTIIIHNSKCGLKYIPTLHQYFTRNTVRDMN